MTTTETAGRTGAQRPASRAVLPEMLERGFGRVVMVSSVTGPLVTAPGSASYAAAKGALDGLMRTIAIEVGRSGVIQEHHGVDVYEAPA